MRPGAPRSSRRRWLGRGILASAAILLAAIICLWVVLRASLPPLDGTLSSPTLAAPVTVERDWAGVPTITAETRRDLAFATGFVHGQDRFFQMDLMRRKAAGELAELVGPAAVAMDSGVRLHRFRVRAERVIAASSPDERELIRSYTAGVNAGVGSLAMRPSEYLLLGAAPVSWRPADTVLVVYAMFLQLNDSSGRRDLERDFAYRRLPLAVYEMLYPLGTEWDAPVVGTATEPPPLPSGRQYDLREVDARPVRPRNGEAGAPLVPGSNNWAVSGALTADGGALVANDMHLGLAVPNTFYRACLVHESDEHRLCGVTLPGTPAVVAGSNGHIAWGFTNSYGDWTDLIAIRPGSSRETYLTPDGERAFEEFRETINIRGSAPVEILIRETEWGPVIPGVVEGDGEYAVSWTAHHVEAVNLGLTGLEDARTVAQALPIAAAAGIPPQNFTVADRNGDIGWTIAGRIPRRAGDFDSRRAADWSHPGTGWVGWLAPEEYPRIVNPPTGHIWTANARVVDGRALRLIGPGDYDLGARAAQIRDALATLDAATTEDMLKIQLDDRALFLSRWRDLLLATLDEAAIAERPKRRAYRRLVEDWVPRASVESVGYRLVRNFRAMVMERVLAGLTAELDSELPAGRRLLASRQFEGPLWRLVNERPAHLLNRDYADWRELLVSAVDAALAFYAQAYDSPLAQRTWGERNTIRIQHPLSRAVPALARWLDMPYQSLPGDANLPRAQGTGFGASERFAVSPGAEERGYFHMPTGQSGHPLSPWYDAGHQDWVQGRATPFLPGETLHRLKLLPAGNGG